MDNQIKILRLKDGEDIISSCEYVGSDIVELHNPMSLFYKQHEGRSMVLMSPWLPVELIKLNAVRIFAREVLTLIEPRDSLIDYYNKIVIQTNNALEENSSQIDDELENNSEFDDTEEEKYLDEIQESLTFKANNKIIH